MREDKLSFEIAGLQARYLAIACQVASLRVSLSAQRVLELLYKAGFNAGQPRIPAGQTGGGRWVGDDAATLISGPRPSTVPIRVGSRVFQGTPAQAAALARANTQAQFAARRVRELDPTWQPRRSFSEPSNLEEAIQRVESETREANLRAAELSRAGFGSNRGPRLDSIDPEATTPQPPRSIDPREAIAAYRSVTGLPYLGNRHARTTTEGTVAFTEIDGQIFFGVNSKAAGYTSHDEAAAMEMRARLIDRHPGVMATDHLGHFPNNALFHAEANVLLRAAEQFGGSLAGREIEIHLDRRLCDSCVAVMPSLGTQIGSPIVRIIDGTGTRWIMRDGIWTERGRP